MDIIQIIVLGIIQGLTEFLPVSSSAHLVLISIVMGWEDQGLLVDVAAHAGSLIAVMFYFRAEIYNMLSALKAPRAQENEKTIRLILAIVIGTIPIVIAGLMFAEQIEKYLRTTEIIAITTIVFALLLAYADRKSRQIRDENQLGWNDVVFIGIAQAFALIPGVSRSGVTMTVGLLLGMTKVAAARFSFLLSIPTILAAIAYKSLKLFSVNIEPDYIAISGVLIISALVAYLCIEVFIRMVNIIGMMPFVIYRIILGVFLLSFI